MSTSRKMAADGLTDAGTSPPAAASNANADWDKLDALFEDLPPGIPILPPEDAGNFERYTYRPRHVYAPGDGWKNCARTLEKYDVDLCKGYREEIDTLLVFAGLFSAVVTAFTIESYQWLQADPNDAIIVLLLYIAQSMSPNGTTAPLVPASAGLSGSVSVRINIYWLLALSLSLSAALVGILCKQWIREFERNANMRPKHFVGVHETKLKGLENWRVGDIISLLPLLLQLALALFALGILELLWRLHFAVAAVVCVPVAIAFFFYAATTILPVLQFQRLEAKIALSVWHTLAQCPYKSPQALLAFQTWYIFLWIQLRLARVFACVMQPLGMLQRDAPVTYSAHTLHPTRFSSWDTLSLRTSYLLDRTDERADTPPPLSLYRSLRWVHQNFYDDDIHESIWHCLWESATEPSSEYPYVEGAEEDSVKRGFGHVNSGSIDVPQIAVRALALGYLLQSSTPRPFVAEACVHHLSTLDPASAVYLTGLMSSWLMYLQDTPVAVAILRAVTAYVRSHIQEPMGHLLNDVTCLAIDNIDHRKRTVVANVTISLYLYWLRAQPVPHLPATVEATERMAWFQCIVVKSDPDWDYRAHPEQLCLRPGVLELAELVSVYVQMHVPEDPLAAFSIGPYSLPPDETRPIVRKLLEIARHGGISGVADAAPSSGESNAACRLPGSSASVGDALSDCDPGVGSDGRAALHTSVFVHTPCGQTAETHSKDDSAGATRLASGGAASGEVGMGGTLAYRHPEVPRAGMAVQDRRAVGPRVHTPAVVLDPPFGVHGQTPSIGKTPAASVHSTDGEIDRDTTRRG